MYDLPTDATLDLVRRMGDRAGEAEALNGLGEALRGAGRPAEAQACHRDALALALSTEDLQEDRRARRGLAALAASVG